MRTTDMADELFSGATQPLPAGVRLTVSYTHLRAHET